jgi:hypothetical protein
MSPTDTTNGRVSELEVLARAANAKFDELRGFL